MGAGAPVQRGSGQGRISSTSSEWPLRWPLRMCCVLSGARGCAVLRRPRGARVWQAPPRVAFPTERARPRLPAGTFHLARAYFYPALRPFPARVRRSARTSQGGWTAGQKALTQVFQGLQSRRVNPLALSSRPWPWLSLHRPENLLLRLPTARALGHVPRKGGGGASLIPAWSQRWAEHPGKGHRLGEAWA